MTSFLGTQNAVDISEWIESAPPGWKASRLKWTAVSRKNGIWGDEADGGPDDILCIRVADFDRDRLVVAATAPTFRKVPKNQRHGRLLGRGDLLLEKSGGGEKQTVGAVVSFNLSQPAISSNFISRVAVANRHHPRFLVYLHASLYFRGVNTRSIKQTTGIQNLDEQAYFDEVAFIPPSETQARIADFLDRKTADIDALIEKKERLIELLAEKRTALIHRAVTKGLDPDVPMKESGVPWIGEIPAHWKYVSLRWLAEVFNGSTPSRNKSEFWSGTRTNSWLSSGKVNDWIVTEPSAQITDRAVRECGLRRAPAGAIVIGMIGQGRTRGTSARLGIDTFINQNMAAIVPGQTIYGPFLHYCLVQAYNPIRETGRGGQQDALTCDLVASIRVALPPFEEQQSIASFLDAQCEDDRAMIEAVQSQNSKLQEYRQALITAAVTGQLEIPEART